MKIIFALIVLSFSAVGFSQSYNKYDYNTGSTYYGNTNQDGSGTHNGYNVNTGSSWYSRTDSSGNSSGTDSNGNYWNYNKGSGTYWNSNGKTCTGKGATRVCTK